MLIRPLKPLAVAVFVASAMPALADHTELDPLVVTAPNMSKALTVETDPKAPRQPIPAHDGADLLKNIPGFSVVRKGGTDGDPVFRGMAASRLSILLDGETILGGCGNRMDPPTAYIFPEAFDNVTILKGPQSVKHGPGSSAGVVNFERATPDFYDSPVHGYVSVLGGSFGRNDQIAQIQAGGQKGFVELNGTRSQADDYRDGNGDKVHSNYERYSGNAALGFTPNVDTKIELTAAKSDGEAAYADRGMDGSKFDRTNLGLSYSQKNITPLISEFKAKVYRNYVDHVMDNYSLRTPPTTGMGAMAMNPDRETIGANVGTTLTVDAHLTIDLGADYQQNEHTNRSGMPNMYKSKPRDKDMSFSNAGVYTEFHYHFPGEHGVHAGIRLDRDQAEDLRLNKDTTGEKDKNWLTSGFLRYEHQLDKENRAYAGVGHSQRAADYWERTRNPANVNMMNSGTKSTFEIDPEKVTQLDIGIMHTGDTVRGSVSAFYAHHDDYILVERLPNTAGRMNAIDARNIRATTYGAEADAAWQFAHHWTTDATVSMVRGENDTDKRALGQIPAHELRLGLTYDNGVWSAGALGRFVNEQDRVAIGQGTIVGQDIGKTSGFAVFSLNAGYRIQEKLILTAGVDNIFDKNYAEHLSRGVEGGLASNTKVNELGRNLWAKLQYSF
ncbi:MAG: TonB-dependent copper receptor [Venatoribacter sp.]